MGLFIPTVISFECPIPGTPRFNRLAAEPDGTLPANGLLCDYTGYTLVVQPARQRPAELVAEYEWVSREVYRTSMKLRKFAHNAPEYAARGYWVTLATDIVAHSGASNGLDRRRSYLAGSDTPPPEATSVPLTDGDFDSEDDRRALRAPWRVTDERGRVLPMWREPVKVFEARGRLSERAQQLGAVGV